MPLSPTTYTGLPRNIRSQGYASLQIPILRLLRDFVREFVLLTLRAIEKGHKLPRPEELMEEYELGEDILSLQSAFDAYGPAAQEWDYTIAGIGSLCQIADDLIANDGTWNDGREMLRDIAHDYVEGLQLQLQLLLSHVLRKYGPKTSRQIIQTIQKRLLRTREELSDRPPVAARDALALALASKESQRIRSVARRANPLIRFVSKLFPKIKLGKWLNGQQKLAVSRCERAINELSRVRFQSLEHQAYFRVLDELLGTESTEGSLDELLRSLEERKQFFAGLKADLSHRGSSSPLPQPIIEVVSSLDDVLDSTTGHRVRDVLFELVTRAGCTPERLAKRLISGGLCVGRRQFSTDQWQKLDPERLVQLLLTAARKYLSLNDEHAVLNTVEPSTAADHLATFDLQHPLLDRRASFCCAEALQRSLPYFEAEPLHDVREHVETFVFSVPKHRKQWITRIQSHGRVAELDNDSAYSIAHPFRVDFLQVAICIPGGASRSIHRSAVLACQNEKHRGVSSHIDRRQFAEQRLLTARVRDIHDCEAMLKAARLAGVVSKRGEERLTLNREDIRLRELFAPSKWRASQITSDTVQALLKHDARTVDFLSRLLPMETELREILTELKSEEDADTVAAELVDRGVFRKLSGLYSVNADFHSRPQDAPPQLLQRLPGRLRGLPESEFLSALLRNDLLYSTLFFAVQDAWQRAWIQKRQVPPSVLEYTQRLF